MGIRLEQLSINYPRLYHVADAGSWPSISKYGLLSTSGLLDLYGINGRERELIESCHRPESVVIRNPQHGTAVIRDQKPMHETVLQKCLVDCTPRQWYQFLNRKVFFWLTESRVTALLAARAHRNSAHIVIIADTEALLRKHGRAALLSPINSGSTIRTAAKRGISSFQPPDSFPYETRRKLRGTEHAVVELAIEYSVPDIREFVLRVERRQGSQVLEVLYST
jgi:uncharacterized protein DUF7002